MSETFDHPRMRAMEIRDGALVLADLPVPSPGPHEVLVRVAYAGVNRADMLQVQGKYPAPEGASPLPGLEVSGTIAALGDQVAGWSVNEEICALLDGGGYAEYVVVPAGQVLPCPQHLGMAEAATLPEAAATAIMALSELGRLHAGERVLLHGGSSGVGLLMAQIAHAMGAQVFATAGGPEKCQFVEGLGAIALDHRAAPFAAQLLAQADGVDLIIDTLGGPAFTDHLKLLKPGGRLVSLAMLQGPELGGARLGALLLKQLTLTGGMLRTRSPEAKAALLREAYEQVWPGIRRGAIRPVIDRIFPLEEAEKAHQRMQERLHCGKILLEVAPK
jgi:NADPH2:quinone reductase